MSFAAHLSTLTSERDAAMHRARWARARGFSGIDIDVRIARHFNRILLRAMRMRA